MLDGAGDRMGTHESDKLPFLGRGLFCHGYGNMNSSAAVQNRRRVCWRVLAQVGSPDPRGSEDTDCLEKRKVMGRKVGVVEKEKKRLLGSGKHGKAI